MFNGKDLIEMKPKEFEETRISKYEESLTNPKNFRIYFDLKEKKIISLTENKKTNVSFDYLDNLILNFFKIKDDEIYNENFESYEEMTINYPKPIKSEFNFDVKKIFFKTDFLLYEQVIF